MEPLQKIPIDKIDDPYLAMRSEMDGLDMDELKASLRINGLIEPIVVRRLGERYEIIAGHRRTRAARLLGWAVIDCIVREATDDETLILRLAENSDRSDVNVVDEAVFLGEIILRGKMTPEQLAEKMHRSFAWVKTRLEIFDMPDYLQNYIRLDRISIGAAHWVAKLQPESKRLYYANYASMHGSTALAAKLWYDMSQANYMIDNERIEVVKSDDGQVISVRAKTECAKCGFLDFIEDIEHVPIHKDDVFCMNKGMEQDA